jgi:hypothetical protein
VGTRLLCTVLLTCLVSSCGGGNGTGSGTPISPTPSTANVAGTWKGTATFQTASPAGHCVADVFLRVAGATAQRAWSVTQIGSLLTVTETQGSDVETLSGTVDAGTITLNSQGTNIGTLSSSCPDGVDRHMRFKTGSVSATVSGSRITGTKTTVYDTWVIATGASSGAVTTIDSFALDRQ